jgi:GAF domain-containing protein
MSEESRTAAYEALGAAARALMDGETDLIANAANIAALLYTELADVNWAGFYFVRDGELVVGPFQGKPACVRIPFGEGVCGTAAATRKTQRVADVHSFDGHIACDVASNSVIVIPLLRDDELIGVLDIDSPSFNRFDAVDQAGLERIARDFVASLCKRS